MGAYTCEFGVVHKVCRCPTPHTIKCDKPKEHGPETALCLVMEMRLDGRLPMPKHYGVHAPHPWWYTSKGGGHQLDHEPKPDDTDYGFTKKWWCPGHENL